MRHLLVYDRTVTYGSTAAFVWQLTRFWFFALIYSTVLEAHVRIDSTDRLTPLSLGVFELIISGSRSWLFCKL